jgi:hypothetical protein
MVIASTPTLDALRPSLEKEFRFFETEPFTVAEAWGTDDIDDPYRSLIGIGGTADQLRFYVVRRTQPVALRYRESTELLTKHLGLPMPAIQIVEVGRPRVFHHAGSNFAPRLPGGIAIEGTGFGTFGCTLLEGTKRFMLTCWHVIESSPYGLVRHSGNGVGSVQKAIAPDFSPGAVNEIDIALIAPDAGIDPQDFILRIGALEGARVLTSMATRVRKMGAETHLTEGVVSDLHARFKIDYSNNRTAVFDGWAVEPYGGPSSFSWEGDSGSVVVDLDNLGVAVVLGGAMGASSGLPHQTFVMPLTRVLSAFAENSTANIELATYP